MKTLALLLLLPLTLATPVDPAPQCGALGILHYNASALPANLSLNEIRTCAEHPLRISPNGAADATLQRRSCWYGPKSGCARGYCWKACDKPESGKWCWTTVPRGLGWGDWMRCTLDSQCSEDMPCGLGKGCSTCGCSC